MNQKISLKPANFPKIIGDLTHSNQFLKVFTFLSLLIAFVAITLAFSFGHREPLVLSFSQDGRTLEKSELPTPEASIREALSAYVRNRYNWTPTEIKEKIKATSAFILPKSVKAFEDAMNEVVKFSLDKDVSQRAYANEIKINLKDSTAVIQGDRVSSIQGLKAVGDLKVLLQYESGPRTKENPWGIYIVKEKEGE